MERRFMGDEERRDESLEEKTVALEDANAVADEVKGGDLDAPPTKRKRNWKKIALYSLAIFVLAMVVLVLSLGLIVKAAVDNALPMVTGTPCSMGFCSFNPVTGTVRVSDLKIGNPEGYGEENAFVLKNMKVSVDVPSIFSDVIVVKEITITGMNVDIETKQLTETNLTDIKANVDKFVKKGEEEAQAPQEEGGEPSEEAGPQKKIIIKLIKFEDNSVTMGVAGKTAPIPMPSFTIEDVGVENGGDTPAEAGFEIMGAIIAHVSKAVGEQAAESVKKGAGSVLEGVKGLFGGGEEKSD
jgi:hypothetical protein